MPAIIRKMEPKVELSSLESMAEALRVYDVDQNGWEGDPEGLNPRTVEANLTHVGFHLADVIERKNFQDDDTARTEIAPDAMQYGLRIARWGDIALKNILPTAYGNGAKLTARTLNLPTYMERRWAPPIFSKQSIVFASFVRASGILARQLHEEDHLGSQQEALSERSDSLRQASALLVQSAFQQSIYKPFDLEEAFDKRLTQLRKRFDIPEPV